MKEKLQTMDAQTLMTRSMEPLKFIVDGFIPQGLHILAGSPKIGKSWLLLWICLQVSKGEKVWEFETRKSEVLYLCLEDSFARIQSRLFEITDDADPLNMISGTSGIAGGADTNFVLQKDKRTERTATLVCTGRDIEGRELFLEFNKDSFVWELREPIEIQKLVIPDEIFALCDYIKSVGTFTGTATELAEILKLELRPAVMKKKIIKHMEPLGRNGIHYSENRTFERREFSLCYDGNDDMTVSNSPIELPSLPSALSVESVAPLFAPV